MPVFFAIEFRIIGRMTSGAFLALAVVYGFAIYFINKKNFEKKDRLRKILEKYSKQTRYQKTINKLVAIVALIASPILFFLFLSFT